MDAKPKVKAVANLAKNRLTITLFGTINKKLLEKLYTEIRFCVADLNKGFDVITNISQCDMVYINCFPVYKKIMNFLIANNVGQIVRIIKKGKISYKQLLNLSDQIQGYKTTYVESEEEAEEILFKKREGVRFKIDKLQFEYETDNVKGTGNILDISTSGCAIDTVSIPLSAETEIFIHLNFDEHDTLTSTFQIKAKIVRADDHIFATQFLDFDEDQQEQLYKRLAHEVNRSTFVAPEPSHLSAPDR